MKILFVSPCNSPFSPVQGGQQRSNLLLKACLRFGDVDVISFCQDTVDDSYGANIIFSKHMIDNTYQYDTRKEKLIRMVGSFFPSRMTVVDKEKEKIIDGLIKNKAYDVIVVRYALSAINCGLYKYAGKLFVDVDDDPAKQISVRGLRAKSFLQKLFFKVYEKNVSRSMKMFNRRVLCATYSNREDASKFNRYFLPNVPFYDVVDLLSTKDIIKGRLLFVGDMTYLPNIEAMNKFVRDILPLVQKQNSEVSLHIVGKCNDENKMVWSRSRGVKVMGFVESLSKEYSEANVFVLPIPKGAGTCIKFLEAAQMGRPIVSSECGFQGYEGIFKPGLDCLVAKGDEEFAKSVLSLLEDDVYAFSMAKRANACLRMNYSKEQFNSIVGKVLNLV